MLKVNLLDAHQSSSIKIYNKLEELAKREDLYTGDDFYFGFDSSNHSFIDIIGGKEPLAIKHGPTLSLYLRRVNGCTYSLFYIDTESRTLLPVISINTKPQANNIFDSIMPWSFKDFYLQATEPAPEAESGAIKSKPSSVQLIQSLIEQLATNHWPNEHLIKRLPKAVSRICSQTEDIFIQLADLQELRKQLQLDHKKASTIHFIAPYDPFNDNARLLPESLKLKNPDQITVRQIGGKDPRIEIISAKSGTEFYNAVYKNISPDLYKEFQLSINEPHILKELLKQHFPEITDSYYPDSDKKNLCHNPR